MKPRSEISPAKIIVTVIFSVAFPLIFSAFLKSTISPVLIVIFPLLKSGLAILEQTVEPGAGRKRIKIISRIASLIFAVFVVIGIVITPYSSYRIWIESILNNSPGGNVSNLSVLLCSFFSASFAGLFFSTDFVWPFLGMSVFSSSFLSFCYQKPRYFLLLGIAILACLAYLAIKEGYKYNRIRAFLLLLNTAVVSLILGAILTGSGKPTGSAIIDNRIYPMLRESMLDLFPGFPLVYAIPGYGFSFDSTRPLGGRPVLSQENIFELDGFDTPRIYLRTRSYDTYDGKSWSLHEQSKSKNQNPLIFSHVGREGEISIKLLTEYYSYLPHTLDTGTIRFEREVPPLQYGNLDTGFVLGKPLRRGETIYLQLEEPQPASNDESQDLTSYLQLPDNLPEEIIILANRLGSGVVDPVIVLRRIQTYLAMNYAYDLEAEMYGQYEDFVTSFLFEKLTGYCVHFATSFTILARLNGIPTRYTTGFLAYRGKEDEPALVSGLASHAWPEVWLPERGWSNWEATPTLNPANYSWEDDSWLYDYDLNLGGLTERQLLSLMGPVRSREQSAQNVAFKIPPVIRYAAVSIAACLLLFLLIRRLRQLSLSHAVGRKNQKNRAILSIMEKVVKALEKNNTGIESPQKTGWLKWRDSLKTRNPALSKGTDRVTRIIAETVYGGKGVRRIDLDYTTLFYRKLKRKWL